MSWIFVNHPKIVVGFRPKKKIGEDRIHEYSPKPHQDTAQVSKELVWDWAKQRLQRVERVDGNGLQAWMVEVKTWGGFLGEEECNFWWFSSPTTRGKGQVYGVEFAGSQSWTRQGEDQIPC